MKIGCHLSMPFYFQSTISQEPFLQFWCFCKLLPILFSLTNYLTVKIFEKIQISKKIWNRYFRPKSRNLLILKILDFLHIFEAFLKTFLLYLTRARSINLGIIASTSRPILRSISCAFTTQNSLWLKFIRFMTIAMNSISLFKVFLLFFKKINWIIYDHFQLKPTNWNPFKHKILIITLFQAK